MSVSGTFRVDTRPYTGYTDPSLPIASWIAQSGQVGDASGGTVITNFLFQDDGQPLISELYNLEQLSYDVSSSASDRSALLETRNMDNLAPNRPASDQFWQFVIQSIANAGAAATQIGGGSALPLWLGQPNRAEGESGIRIQTLNTDLLLYACTLQGYIWGPRSVLADGGPRRPEGGLYGD